ncbi:DUF803-domain-containing protein [Daedalea quercina L-15889]|uniref:DUF803-domain-containing protein n=1 Tax=Daedalea quercina L-15889 TaxID=1314783 RepID=A0A165KWT4_9APHY|nr:DUF803-domain-containing protein [Daedalea quercina L-15889]
MAMEGVAGGGIGAQCWTLPTRVSAFRLRLPAGSGLLSLSHSPCTLVSMPPSPSTSTSAAASASSSAASGTFTVGGNLKIVGIILAISSGVLIGSSFVFKKKGLLRSQGHAGEGVAYLKSPLWWTGMTLMILGEICNFVAYAFVEAIVVTPMGALSVVICAILSHFFLAEKLSFFGWLGCGLCIVGSVIIALNGPQESTPGQIRQFEKMFLAPGFLAYGSTLIVAALVIVFFFAPRYGTKSMLWYIMVCSMIGGISVSVTTGLGAAVVTSAEGDNQFNYWFTYFLLGFIVVTLVTEVFYLNKALALFNTAMVTPTYYVIFTFFSMLTTIVLFQGLSAPATQIITLVMGFITICFGITILQLSKIDPTELKVLDRRSTILLQAAKQETESMEEKNLTAVEDPGIDALRGTFGMVGSVIRARSAHRMSMSSRGSVHSRRSGDPLAGMKRHQLWDAPVPSRTPSMADVSSIADKDRLDERSSVFSGSHLSSVTALGSPVPRERKQTIKFDSQDVVHSYHQPGTGDNSAIHERRGASHQTSTSPPVKSTVSKEADAQVITIPVSDSLDDIAEESGNKTAPPRLGLSTDPYHPPVQDIFENTPSTATEGYFAYSPDEPRRSASPLHPQSHHGRFWRSPGGRRYPSTGADEDREESESLWRRGTESDEDVPVVTPSGGIRLVTNHRR